MKSRSRGMKRNHSSCGLDQLGPKYWVHPTGFEKLRGSGNTLNGLAKSSMANRRVKVTLCWQPLKADDIRTVEDI